MIEIGDLLKSDKVIEFLELHDVDVIYQFDRLNEGESDSYFAVNEEIGIEMKFDANQNLIVIWIKKIDFESARKWIKWQHFSTGMEVEYWALNKGYNIINGDNWMRADDDNVCYHYTFDSNGISMVTIMDKSIAPYT